VKIYTRTGDRGETGLLGGQRVPKDHVRVAACGEVDEANAALGAVRSFAEPRLEALLASLQKDLFAVGAQLADPSHAVAARRAKAAVKAGSVRRLERLIDAREARLPQLRAFVLPGGSPAAALLHQARAVCRRAERAVVTLARDADVDPRIVVYLNRLSDLLFVLARSENRRAGIAEARW
jgi:cob(I)alamin adenosyltransferase